MAEQERRRKIEEETLGGQARNLSRQIDAVRAGVLTPVADWLLCRTVHLYRVARRDDIADAIIDSLGVLAAEAREANQKKALRGGR